MKATIDELYLGINTDLTPHDLVSVVFDEVIEGWFRIACAATERGEFIAGDLADDTKLDGRGSLPLPGEDPADGLSRLDGTMTTESVRDAVLARLDSLDLEDDASELQVSCIGSTPSGFRREIDGKWYPRCAPSFYFKPGRSVFEISFFDVSWITEPADLDEFTSRLSILCEALGDRRVTLVEFECDGKFLATEEDWRIQFAPLPLASKDLRG